MLSNRVPYIFQGDNRPFVFHAGITFYTFFSHETSDMRREDRISRGRRVRFYMCAVADRMSSFRVENSRQQYRIISRLTTSATFFGQAWRWKMLAVGFTHLPGVFSVDVWYLCSFLLYFQEHRFSHTEENSVPRFFELHVHPVMPLQSEARGRCPEVCGLRP